MAKWTKSDAANEQLDAAIGLLAERQLIAAHTLVSAAAELSTACAKAKGKRTNAMVLDDLIARLLPESVAEFRRAMRKPQNFAKHADRDPDEELDVKPELTVVTLYQAIIDMGVAFERLTFRQLIFRTWFLSRNWGRWPAEQRAGLAAARDIFPNVENMTLDDALEELRVKLLDLDAPDLRARFQTRMTEMKIDWGAGVWNPQA
jgi:hypothetical protein